MLTRSALILFISATVLFAQEKYLPARINTDSIASSLYSEGNYWKLMEISKQYNTDSLSPKFLFSLGMSYAALSEPQRAQEFLKRSIMLDSTKLQYRFQFARLLSQSGLYQEALDQLEQCIAMDSSYIPARFQMGLTYAAQKIHPEREIGIFASLITRNPNDFLSLYYISEALKRSGKPDSAAYYLRQSLSVNPRYYPALIAIANYLSGKKLYAEALPYYLTADSLRGNTKDLKFQIGECYRKLDSLTRAIRYYQHAIVLDSTNALYHAQLAYAYFSKEQFDSSAASYHQAITYDEENPQYHLNLALVYLNLNMPTLVIQSYQNAIRVMHPEAIAYAYNDLATFCYQKKLWKEAVDAYKQAVNIKPDLVDPYYFMGSSYMQLSEHQAALANLTIFLRLTENDKEKKGERYSAQKMVEYVKSLKKNK